MINNYEKIEKQMDIDFCKLTPLELIEERIEFYSNMKENCSTFDSYPINSVVNELNYLKEQL